MRKQRRRQDMGELPFHGKADERIKGATHDREPGPKSVAAFKSLTPTQEFYAKGIRGSLLTIGVGPAGTGKSYCSVALACEMLIRKDIDRIIATRPAVEADEDLGFLPGGITEKFSPYFAPIMSILNERLGESFAAHCIKTGKIVAQPLAFMRGHTFKRAFVLLDEAQNTTPKQMKMLLTRLGEPVKCVIEGDIDQTDIDGANGLEDLLNRFRGHQDVRIVEFQRSDIVRSGFVQDVVEMYDRPMAHRRALDLGSVDIHVAA